MTKDDLVTPALLGFIPITNEHPASAGHRNDLWEKFYLKLDHVPYGYVWRWITPDNNSMSCTASVHLMVDFTDDPLKPLTIGAMRDDLAGCNECGFYSALLMHIDSHLDEII